MPDSPSRFGISAESPPPLTNAENRGIPPRRRPSVELSDGISNPGAARALMYPISFRAATAAAAQCCCSPPAALHVDWRFATVCDIAGTGRKLNRTRIRSTTVDLTIGLIRRLRPLQLQLHLSPPTLYRAFLPRRRRFLQPPLQQPRSSQSPY